MKMQKKKKMSGRWGGGQFRLGMGVEGWGLVEGGDSNVGGRW